MNKQFFKRTINLIVASLMFATLSVPASAASYGKSVSGIVAGQTIAVGNITSNGTTIGSIKCTGYSFGKANCTCYSSVAKHFSVISGKKTSSSSDVKPGYNAITGKVTTNNGKAWCGGTVLL